MSFTRGTTSRIGEATQAACDVLMGASSSFLHLVLFVRTYHPGDPSCSRLARPDAQ